MGSDVEILKEESLLNVLVIVITLSELFMILIDFVKVSPTATNPKSSESGSPKKRFVFHENLKAR